MTFSSRLDEAVSCTQRALAILEENYGKAHELALDARFLLANQYWWQSRVTPSSLSTAMALMDDSIALYQKRNGEVPALHRIAYSDLLAESGRGIEAQEQIAIAKRDAVRQYGADSEEMLHVRSSEIDVKIANGSQENLLPVMDQLVTDARSVDSLYAPGPCTTCRARKWAARS